MGARPPKLITAQQPVIVPKSLTNAITIPNRSTFQSSLSKSPQLLTQPQLRQTHIDDTIHSNPLQDITDTYGDFPHHTKQASSFRVIYANVNGLSTSNLEQECHQIGATADAHHIDFLGLVEINVNWQNSTVQRTVCNTLRKYWKKTVINGSSTPTLNTTTYQPGGTLSLVGNHWTGGSRAYEDTGGMGRWTEVRIQGRQHRQLIIVTTYRVPQATITTAGPSTSYYHQWHYLRCQGEPHPDPRSKLLQDLGDHLTSLQNENTAILILMDANEAYTDRNSKLHTWLQQYSFVDVHQALHNHDTSIPTYNRGSRRIDYMFSTPNLLPYVQQGGILPFHFLKNTDH